MFLLYYYLLYIPTESTQKSCGNLTSPLSDITSKKIYNHAFKKEAIQKMLPITVLLIKHNSFY